MTDQQKTGATALSVHGISSLASFGSIGAIFAQNPALLSQPSVAIPLGIIAVAYVVSSLLPGILQSIKDFRNK